MIAYFVLLAFGYWLVARGLAHLDEADRLAEQVPTTTTRRLVCSSSSRPAAIWSICVGAVMGAAVVVMWGRGSH